MTGARTHTIQAGRTPAIAIAALVLSCIFGSSSQAQVQNISAWTLQTSDSADVTVGGITYLNNYATPLTITTAVGTYNAGTAGAGADDVFIRRNTATPTGTTNVAGQAISSLSASSGSATVYGTYSATMQDLLLGGNVLNSTWDTFANTSSGAGGVGHNIERIDFVWTNGYTVVGDEVLVVFNFDPVGAQDDFRIAVFTGIDNSANKLPTAYASAGVLVSGTNYPDKLPLPLSGSPTTSTSSGWRTTATDDLSGTALNRGDSQTVGIGGVAISLASLGISAGQTIFGYSLLSADTVASSAAALVDFTNSSIYPTSTPNADASGTPDFSTFGGKIATSTVSIGSAAFEWDRGAGTSSWGSTVGGESNANWYSPVTAENNRTPFRDGDIIFGTRPTAKDQQVDLGSNVEVRSMTFDSGKNYSIGTVGGAYNITFGDPNLAGLPSINVNDTSGAHGLNKINADIFLVEDISVNNNSYSTLCLNGTLETNSTLAPQGNSITVTGFGDVNFNGNISGSGDLIKTGVGIATINNNNSDDPAGAPTPWIGNVSVDAGMVVVTADGALGGSVSRATNASSGGGATTLKFADANAADLKVGQIVTGTGIPTGTFITAISSFGGTTTITLSQALTTTNTSGSAIVIAGATTVNDGGVLALRGSVSNVSYTTAETITLNGTGFDRGGERTGALYNDGGDNTLGANVSLRLATDSGIGSRDGNLTINGVISETGGSRSLTKFGAGVVTLGGTNTYTGATIIQGGALRVTSTAALPGGFATGAPSGGNLQLAGGVLEIGTATTFSRQLGTAADQVQWTGDGGFSAFGGARTVTLTNAGGTAGGTLTWNAGSFVPTGNALLLSSDYSDNIVTLTNAIDFGGATREVRVANGTAAVDGVLSGVLSNGGLNKTGTGTLEISGTNTYSGNTILSGGALRVSSTSALPGGFATGAPSGGNLQLAGGVLEINTATTFSRQLGASADQVQWTSDGGFAAAGAARTVTLTNAGGTAGGTLTWNAGSFVPTGNALVFGSTSSNNTATLTNAIDLAGADRTIKVINGTAGTTVAEGVLSGVISSGTGTGSLTVIGNGRLDSTAANTFTGTVTVQGAELRLQGNGTMASATGYTVGEGGILRLDNSGTNNTNRLSDSAGVTLSGGTLSFLGRAGSSTETVGALTLAAGGGNTVATQRNGTNSAVLTLASLTRNVGSTVDFSTGTGGGTLGSTGGNPRTVFTTAPTLANGILAYATVNGTDFASYASVNGTTPDGVYAYNAYDTGAQTGWTAATDNAAPTADQTLTSARTINSLKLASGIDVAQAGLTLTVQSGGILTTGATAATISGGSLTTGNSNELIVHAYNTGGTTISSTIDGTGGLTKTGTGTLTLSGTAANTNTGDTYVNDGTLILAKSDSTTALAGNIRVGDGSGTDILQINANEQIADTANVTLHGNSLGNGETKLVFGGGPTGSVSETFASLTIEGTAVLDFAGGTVCSPNFLYLSALNIPADGSLLIRNWIEFSDYLLVDVNLPEDVLARIHFEGYASDASYTAYDSVYKQIRPVPEPSTYGFMMMGAGLAFYGLRRQHRSKPRREIPAAPGFWFFKSCLPWGHRLSAPSDNPARA